MKTIKITSIISLTTVLFALVFPMACSLNRSSLDIEAQVIYNMGGPQPIARQTFYLLDADVADLASSTIKKSENLDKSKVEGVATTFVLFSMNQEKPVQKKSAFETFLKSKTFWESHIVQTAETDFTGKASFANLKASDYWIVAMAETRAGVAVWNYKVSVKSGENKVSLDQNNAVFSN